MMLILFTCLFTSGVNCYQQFLIKSNARYPPRGARLGYFTPLQTAKGKASPWARKSGVLTSQWEIHVCIISQWAHLTFVNDATQTCRWCFSNEIPGGVRCCCATAARCSRPTGRDRQMNPLSHIHTLKGSENKRKPLSKSGCINMVGADFFV